MFQRIFSRRRKKRTILLDYYGTLAFFEAGLFGLLLRHFNLLMTTEIYKIICSTTSDEIRKQLDDFALTKRRILLVDSGMGTEELNKAMVRLNVPVDAEGRYLHNVFGMVRTVVPDSMISHYEAHGTKLDYVLVSPDSKQEPLKILVEIEKRGGIVVSPYELGLLLYHDGKLTRETLQKTRGY